MYELSRGANAAIAERRSETPSFVVDVGWNSHVECDVTAIVCNADRTVLDDAWFLFWGQRESPDRNVWLLAPEPHADRTSGRSQVLLGLAELPVEVTRIVVSLSTVQEGADLGDVRGLVATVIDLVTGEPVVRCTFEQEKAGTTCTQLLEIYAHSGHWKVRTIDQGYDTGLAGLGRDYGVNIV